MPADFHSARPIAFPCATPRLVPAERVVANDYNPNRVATPEMESLARSIAACGVTQAIVCSYDESPDRYLVVDGFHRLVILRAAFGAADIPVIGIGGTLAERIIATLRHNKARGEHQVAPVARLVRLLMAEGWDDATIAEQMGMEGEELLRLKLIEGIVQTR